MQKKNNFFSRLAKKNTEKSFFETTMLLMNFFAKFNAINDFFPENNRLNELQYTKNITFHIN